MPHETVRPLTFEALLTDPLTRLVMDADGVTVADLVAVMRVAREAVARREREAVARAVAWTVAAGARGRPALRQSATT
jgi:hypothetical protein